VKYHFLIRKEGTGFWAECMELEGCLTQADSRPELLENMREALNTYLQEPEDSDWLAPLPKKHVRLTKSLVAVPVDPEVAFAFMVRHHRVKKRLTQKEAAQRMGFGNLYSYQRLEKRCNASLSMIGKVKDLFPDFSIDLAFS
jgi:predicted RNase H-like HicB family nuclease